MPDNETRIDGNIRLEEKVEREKCLRISKMCFAAVFSKKKTKKIQKLKIYEWDWILHNLSPLISPRISFHNLIFEAIYKSSRKYLFVFYIDRRAAAAAAGEERDRMSRF